MGWSNRCSNAALIAPVITLMGRQIGNFKLKILVLISTSDIPKDWRCRGG
jgi:hypothetical protein